MLEQHWTDTLAPSWASRMAGGSWVRPAERVCAACGKTLESSDRVVHGFRQRQVSGPYDAEQLYMDGEPGFFHDDHWPGWPDYRDDYRGSLRDFRK